MRVTVSPVAFRRLAVAAAVALAAIVVTGGAVRLTGSGLGCPTWPRCTATSITSPATYHGLVEFVNRVVSFLVGVFVLGVTVAAFLRRPRRRDLTVLSAGLVAGVVAQAVVGGLSVLFHLSPGWVMAHFLLSMALLWVAVLLVHRADPRWAPVAPSVPRPLLLLTRLLVGVAGLVLVLGTVTTGTGPHGGDPGKVTRFALPLERVTQLHADSALFLSGLVVAVLFAVRLVDTTAVVRRRAHVLAAALLAQVAIGYAQYFLNLPPGLVGVHIAGATALWCAALWLELGTTAPERAPVLQRADARSPVAPEPA